MNKLIVLLLLTTNFMLGQELANHYSRPRFKNGESYALFGNDVKFRTAPSSDAEVIELLEIGTDVKILAQTTETLLYNGLESPFFKVDHKGKTGYILGGLISLEKKESENATYLFAYKKQEEDYSILVRRVAKNGDYTEISSDLGMPGLTIQLFDNKGLSGIKNILYIDNEAQACGIMGGGIYFFETKNGFEKVFETVLYSDAEVSWFKEILIFPTDENGVADRIVYQKNQGEYGDIATNELKTYETTRELRWENGQIVPKISNEEQ